MANAIPPPEQFSFAKPETWPKWIKRFDRYTCAAGVNDSEKKVNTLLYSMGQQAEDVVLSFNLTTDQAKDYDVVRTKLDNYFVVRRNVIFERAKFNRRCQGENESVDAFIRDLYNLVEHCGYDAMEEEMLRDRIVVGIKDIKLSENLQAVSTLTLKDALDKVRTKELISKQSTYLRENRPSNNAEADAVQSKAVHKTFTGNKGYNQSNRSNSFGGKSVNSSRKCEYCGHVPGHSRRSCPAQNKKCYNCGSFGHFKSLCKSKSSSSVKIISAEEEETSYFLGVVEEEKNTEWDIHLSVDGTKLKFKIDTGADVTVISQKNFDTVVSSSASKLASGLSSSDKVLLGASGKPLTVRGMFKAELCVGGRSSVENVYVVQNLKKPLLGKPAIKALGVVSFTKPVEGFSFKEKVIHQFPKLFTGLGEIEGEYSIKLQNDAVPVSIASPRRVAVPLLPRVKSALEEMVQNGVVRKLSPNEVSPWCSGMVVVLKSSGDVRICVDLTNLNKYVIRPRIQIPTVESTLAKLGDAKVFSKLDANSGFYQIKLSPESQLLTTFITPYGRYCYRRLPFGVSSGPECFQDKINGILEGLGNVHCQMDDILVDSSTVENHEKSLLPVLQRLQDANITLNVEKCEFAKSSVTFVGQNISEKGISAEQSKIKALSEMAEPKNIHELRRFMGMCNQLGKFSPVLAELSKPMRELLSVKRDWAWGPAQTESFIQVKEELCSPRVLAIYSPKRETIVSADSSSYGLGAVLLQKDDRGQFRPVYYASRSLSETERGYAQIEKEALATTWACEKFTDYLIGMDFTIETDHKPLISLLGKKGLSDLPPRILRFRLRLMRFRYKIVHIPGKEMYTADTFSRAPLAGNSTESSLCSETESFVNLVVNSFPASERKLVEIRENQHDDAVCSRIREYTIHGWPSKHEIEGALRPYYQFNSEFSILDGLLLKNDRLVIPMHMRNEILDKIHEGHLGIVKCNSRARDSVWWPGITKQIEEVVRNCTSCLKTRPEVVEPMIGTPLPDLPWEKVGADLGYFKGENYLIVVDYYSRFVEMCHLGKDTTSNDIIRNLKSIFARHGVPSVLRSDNGPQFSNVAFQKFSESYGFTHITSSPGYPTGNGEVERAVQTIKNLLKRNDDPYIALLSYRNTKLHNGYSPAELLMGRRLRTTLPVPRHTLRPIGTLPGLVEREEKYRDSMKLNYDVRHSVSKSDKVIDVGDKVLVKLDNTGKMSEPGVVVSPAGTPRSFNVNLPEKNQTLRRTSRHIVPTHNTDSNSGTPISTRSGRVVNAPKRLDL